MKEERYFDLSVLVGNWESVNLHPTNTQPDEHTAFQSRKNAV